MKLVTKLHKTIKPYQMQVGSVGIVKRSHQGLFDDKLVVRAGSLLQILGDTNYFTDEIVKGDSSFFSIELLPAGTKLEV